MKKYFTASLIGMTTLFILSIPSLARQKAETSYPLILNFYSIGSGTPSDKPLKSFITTYRKKNKLPLLNATVVGGLGREGEYAIVFPLKELTAIKQKTFIASLSKAIPKLNSKSENGGGINLSKNQPFNVNQGRGESKLVVF